MMFLDVNFETLDTTLKSFDRVADKFSNDILIKVNSAFYRIVDFEFYTFSKAFPDPHTYKNDLQLQNGKLYIHNSGVDITFGDGINYGGILLRGIIKLSEGSGQDSGFMGKQFSGSQIVATELFSNLNNLFSLVNNEIALVDKNESEFGSCFCLAEKIMKTKRVGLTPKPNDVNHIYRDLPLRHIVLLPKFPKFKQVIKGIEGILHEQVLTGEMKVEEAHEILGYQKRFQ